MKSRAIVFSIGLLLVMVLAASPVMAESVSLIDEEASLAPTEGASVTTASDEGSSIDQMPRRTNSRPPRRVKSPMPPETTPVRLEGTIEHVDKGIPGEPYYIVVHGDSIRVTPETVITPEDHVLTEGDYVSVDATSQGAEYVARTILVMESRIEFRGIITYLPADLYANEDHIWIIAGKSVEVATRENVVGTPFVGYYAHVDGWIIAGDRVRAERVVVISPEVAIATFEFKGIIQEKPPTNAEPWLIAGVQGWVNEDTKRTGEIELGTVVRVSGRRLPGGDLAFEEIEALSEENLYLEGRIQRAAEETWVVDGQEIEITDMTFIDESGGRAEEGMWAEVTAYRGPFGGVIALRIRVRRPE